MSVDDSRAPPKKWGVFAVQDMAERGLRRVVAIKVIRRGWGGKGWGCNPQGSLSQVLG